MVVGGVVVVIVVMVLIRHIFRIPYTPTHDDGICAVIETGGTDCDVVTCVATTPIECALPSVTGSTVAHHDRRSVKLGHHPTATATSTATSTAAKPSHGGDAHRGPLNFREAHGRRRMAMEVIAFVGLSLDLALQRRRTRKDVLCTCMQFLSVCLNVCVCALCVLCACFVRALCVRCACFVSAL
jgi:hypothetical protein